MKINSPKLWVLLLIIIVIIIYFWKKSGARKTVVEKTALPDSRNYLVLDLESDGNIASVEPKQRALLGVLHDSMFESEKWIDQLPKLSFNPDWKIQQLPATKNTVLRFKVWNERAIQAVDVLFDPYGIMTGKPDEALWQVSAPGSKTFTVPIQDTDQLRAIIASVLQEVSPLEIE
jgi:hypothetical protein